MIDPTNIINYNRTESELEEFLLFCILVAGKNSGVQAKKLEEFLLQGNVTRPFEFIQKMNESGHLLSWMKICKLGQYARLEKAFLGVTQFKDRLSKVTAAELESVAGIGPKTVRFFLLYSRPNQKIAVFDTHVLRWMRSLNINAPTSTPRKEKYAELEQIYLTICEEMGIDPAKLDLIIWNAYQRSKKSGVVQATL